MGLLYNLLNKATGAVNEELIGVKSDLIRPGFIVQDDDETQWIVIGIVEPRKHVQSKGIYTVDLLTKKTERYMSKNVYDVYALAGQPVVNKEIAQLRIDIKESIRQAGDRPVWT